MMFGRRSACWIAADWVLCWGYLGWVVGECGSCRVPSRLDSAPPQRSTLDFATIPPATPRPFEDPHGQPPDAQHRNGTLRRNLSVIGVTHADHVTGSSPRARPSTSRPDTTPTLTGSLPTTSSSISTTRRARRGNWPPRLPSSETLRLGVCVVPIIPHVVARCRPVHTSIHTKLYPALDAEATLPCPTPFPAPVLACSLVQPCAFSFTHPIAPRQPAFPRPLGLAHSANPEPNAGSRTPTAAQRPQAHSTPAWAQSQIKCLTPPSKPRHVTTPARWADSAGLLTPAPRPSIQLTPGRRPPSSSAEPLSNFPLCASASSAPPSAMASSPPATWPRTSSSSTRRPS